MAKLLRSAWIIAGIRALHEKYGHVQEVIVQKFSSEADIPMAKQAEPSMEDMLRTIAVAR